MSETSAPVHVIGGGPGGLATAAALQARGVRAVVVERSSEVGASWRGHYDRLRLHTTRRWSGLPGLPIPRSAGRWVSRDDFVRYLERYTRHHRLDLAAGVEVFRIEPAGQRAACEPTAQQGRTARHGQDSTGGQGDPAQPHQGDGGTRGADHPGRDGRQPSDQRVRHQNTGTGWLLRANGGRVLRGSAIVVATGYNHTPHVPDWPGRDGYTGELLHAREYRNAERFAGLDVLVVGVGNTGAEIAADLAANGAGRVRLAVRTPPHIVRRSTLGWPAQASAVLVRRLPVRLVNRAGRVVTKLIPDLTAYGLPRPDTGLYSRVLEGAIPVQDAGLVRAVRRRQVQPVGAVEAFTGDTVRLAGGEEISPEVVITATGYRRGLEPLVGHLDLLDSRGLPTVHGQHTHPGAPGLYFTGYTNPISGMLRELSRDAPRIAAAIARER